MKIITAIEKYDVKDDEVSVFLAGGITNCPNWQADVIAELKRLDEEMPGKLDGLVIFNPRRDNFPIDDPNASVEQITWEFNELQRMDVFSIYFTDGTSDQPICLYELGRNVLRMQRNFPIDFEKRIVISCHPDYRRSQDVRIQTKLAWEEVPLGGEFIKRDRPEIEWKTDPVSHAARIVKAYEYVIQHRKEMK